MVEEGIESLTKMAGPRLLLLLFGLCELTWGFLNLEELTHMKYGIEIAAEPVLRGQSKSDDIVLVSSKYKQAYECRLPALAVKFHHDRDEDQQRYSGQGISDLLKPMETAPCLIKTKDWWTYELCYGKHIQQYHMEELEVKGDVLYLGYYQSEFDWNNETAKATKHHRLKRYHSQLYVNGSKCDLNGRTREAEVRFVCEEGSGDYIARIDEPQSCAYVLTVHTTRICHHPFLRPPSTARPQSIHCHPALSPEQYVEYVHAQVSDTKQIVEEISEELNMIDSEAWRDKGSDPTSAHPDTPRRESVLYGDEEQRVADDHEETLSAPGRDSKGEDLDDSEDDFWNKVLRPQDGDGTEAMKDDSNLANVKMADDQIDGVGKKFQYKVIRNSEELVKFIDGLKQNVKKEDEEIPPDDLTQSTETLASDDVAQTEKPPEDDDDESELLREFEKELEDILIPKSEMSEVKEDVKVGVESQFDNIIDETQEELAAEGLKGEFDRKQASKYLASTLNKLINKLDDKDPEPGTDQEEGDEDIARGNPGPAAKYNDDEDSDARVKVRVTKVKPGSRLQKEMKVREMSHENPQLRHIENVVKDLLEKEGLKAEGKIEIKILTTGAFNDDDETHWLSEEDTKSLKDIFFNILIHGTEEVHKEKKRQQQLEENYRFVWDHKADNAKKSGSNTDSDELDF
ncbi:protein OS-9 isoform X2 [Pleurodeles waltl]|uniref:protein OS-9 isoform X2 n=1 Tax=Pleurodeles waltl TaxID=8319 RepID=UPI0037097458